MADLMRYAFDSRTNEYVGPAGIHPDPMNPGSLLEPAFTVLVAPPAAPAGEVAVWTGSTWTLEQDNRGQIWFSGTEPVLIEALGDPAAHGLTTEPVLPPAPPPSSCSKLGLKRAFVEKGWWTTVQAMIAGNAEFAEDWSLAVELHISDPLIKEAVYGLAQLGLALSDADVQALVTRANELVRPAPAAA